MSDCEAVANFDFLPIFAPYAEEGADYAVLVNVAPCGVIEDGEDGLGARGLVRWYRRVTRVGRYLGLYYDIERRC